MRDFTLETYQILLTTLLNQNYTFKTFEQFIRGGSFDEKMIVMRHDVDRLPENALVMARIEKILGIKGTYFFRTIKSVFKPGIIKEIAEMGHEIGYHYENLGMCNGDCEKAVEDFESNLNKIRQIFPVKCICMHGNALKKWDNRDLWKKYDYKNYGIICEPYLDLNFNQILYLTDTGQRWNGNKFSLRDKTDNQTLSKKYLFRNTFEIIKGLKDGMMPNKLILNIHPERWRDNKVLWMFFAFEQFFKRNIKLLINKIKNE